MRSTTVAGVLATIVLLGVASGSRALSAEQSSFVGRRALSFAPAIGSRYAAGGCVCSTVESRQWNSCGGVCRAGQGI